MKILKSIRPSEWIFYIMLILAISILTHQVFMFGRVPSGSMEPTLQVGNAIMGCRFEKDNIERYNVVVFRNPDNKDEYYIKRVIGLPGESIIIIDGMVYADGKLLEDQFVKELSHDSGEYEVPEDSYFMLGDNRCNSNDSRFWKHKYVNKEDIVAKAKYVIWPSIKKIK